MTLSLPGGLSLEDRERLVLDAIDVDWILSTLSALVQVPSWDGGERPAQEYMAELLGDLGFQLDVWEIDERELSLHPDYASEIPRSDPLGVVGSLAHGSGGPTLVLNGHVDVVPPGDESRWTSPPFRMEERGGRVYGRGVLDMKGPVVAALAGIKAVVGSGTPLAGSVLFQSVVGEEDGGLGTLAAVLRGHTGDGAVVLEPTGLSVAPAQAGALNFRLIVPGSAAHGAVRHEGVSAIENFIWVYRDLMDFEAERNREPLDPRFQGQVCPYPICIGTIQGGEWASSVPEAVRAEGRFGVAVSESVESARRVLEDRVARACAAHGWLSASPVTVEWWGGQFAPCATDPGARIVEVAHRAVRTLGLGGEGLVGVPYGSDLRHLVNAGGTPGVLMGPGEVAGAHREDESIGVDELVDGARAVALTVLRFLG